MYNTAGMIEAGRAAMRRNPARDITALELHRIRENAAGDDYKFAEDAFLLGVAIGMRIAAAEARGGPQISKGTGKRVTAAGATQIF